jgi:hypothetical protein
MRNAAVRPRGLRRECHEHGRDEKVRGNTGCPAKGGVHAAILVSRLRPGVSFATDRGFITAQRFNLKGRRLKVMLLPMKTRRDAK